MNFSAKILLFGEYTVIRGGAALALPYRVHSGRWAAGAPVHDWGPLLRFVQTCPELLDVAALERDVSRGHGFLSDIPQGKGLGSSGALVAALYHAYGRNVPADLDGVRACLARLEACYHGQSSGVDPLVSWVARPLLLRGQEAPAPVDLPLADWTSTRRWFLLDSGVARHSAPLIAVYRRKMEDEAFQGRMRALAGMVEELVGAYRDFDEAHLGIGMEELSRLQWDVFQEMIPAPLRELWEQGLDERRFALKLCGAGGGGYFLGYRLRGEVPSDATFF